MNQHDDTFSFCSAWLKIDDITCNDTNVDRDQRIIMNFHGIIILRFYGSQIDFSHRKQFPVTPTRAQLKEGGWKCTDALHEGISTFCLSMRHHSEPILRRGNQRLIPSEAIEEQGVKAVIQLGDKTAISESFAVAYRMHSLPPFGLIGNTGHLHYANTYFGVHGWRWQCSEVLWR